MIDFSLEPEIVAELAWMNEFVAESILPLETLDLTDDQYRRLTEPLKQQVKERGLWAAHLPRDLGGGGHGLLQLGLMYEVLGQSSIAQDVFGIQSPDSGNAVLLATAATPDQRSKWLEPLLAQRMRSAFSMTEPAPGAGADPTLMATTAELDGDEWVINGHKWFTSSAAIADFFLVVCRTDPDAGPLRSCSIIIVPAGIGGLEIVREIPNMADPAARVRPGHHSHSEITYTDVRVPSTNLLGERGGGFLLAQTRLGPARVHRCMEWIGICHRALAMMCEYAKSRTAFGSTLAEKQTVQNWIADSTAEISAARLMTLHAAWKIETFGAKAARVEIASIKFFAAQVLFNVIDRAIQVHGSLGFSCDMPLESMYREARNARIIDGPDEVHRQTVARLTLAQYEATEIPTEHVPTRRGEALIRFAGLLEDSG